LKRCSGRQGVSPRCGIFDPEERDLRCASVPNNGIYALLRQAGQGGRRTDERRERAEIGGQRSEVAGQEGYREWLNKGIEELIGLAKNQDGHGIQAKLKELVPEYTPQESKCVL
jgi:hypothetical protein